MSQQALLLTRIITKGLQELAATYRRLLRYRTVALYMVRTDAVNFLDAIVIEHNMLWIENCVDTK